MPRKGGDPGAKSSTGPQPTTAPTATASIPAIGRPCRRKSRPHHATAAHGGTGTFTDPLSDTELKRRIRRKHEHEKRQHGDDPIRAFNALMSSLRVQLTYRKNQAGAKASAVKRRIRKIMGLAETMYGLRVSRARAGQKKFDAVLRANPKRPPDTITAILRRKR